MLAKEQVVLCAMAYWPVRYSTIPASEFEKFQFTAGIVSYVFGMEPSDVFAARLGGSLIGYLPLINYLKERMSV